MGVSHSLQYRCHVGLVRAASGTSERTYKYRQFDVRAIYSLRNSSRQDMAVQTTSVSAEGGAHPGYTTARSSDELSNPARELSAGGPITVRQATPGATNDTVDQTKAQRLRARIQFATLCWTLYLAGWNDGSTGPLLPRIQKVYDVGVPVIVHGADVDTRVTGQSCGGIPHFRVRLHCGCRFDFKFSVGVTAGENLDVDGIERDF